MGWRANAIWKRGSSWILKIVGSGVRGYHRSASNPSHSPLQPRKRRRSDTAYHSGSRAAFQSFVSYFIQYISPHLACAHPGAKGRVCCGQLVPVDKLRQSRSGRGCLTRNQSTPQRLSANPSRYPRLMPYNRLV